MAHRFVLRSVGRTSRPARGRLLLCTLLLIAAAGGGCDGAAPADEARWSDLGLISGVGDVGGLVVVGGDVLLGTDSGLWRRPLVGGTGWMRSGLEGFHVKTIRLAPDGAVLVGGDPRGREEVFPFYRSEDGGQTWTGYGEGLYNTLEGAYVGVEDLAVQPRTGAPSVLYANMLASSIARSHDGGRTWTYVKGEVDAFGYPCLLHVRPEAPETLYQGCEEPLDFAWVRVYDLTDPQASRLDEGQVVVDREDISNRRINAFFSTPSRPGVLYVGLEGALIAVDEDGWRWIWEQPDGVAREYTYVRMIWVDPADPDHLIFGGGSGDGAEATRAGLHETFDGGRTVRSVPGRSGVDFTRGGVRAGAAAGAGGEDLVLAYLGEAGVRVLVRHPSL